MTDKNSFIHIPEWLEEVNKLNSDNPLKIVLGNKHDMSNRQVTETDTKPFSQMYDLEVLETSAKSSFNIHETFEKIGKTLIARANERKVHVNSGRKEKDKYKLSSKKSSMISNKISFEGGACCKQN